MSAVVRRLPRRAVLAAGRRLGRLWGALDRRHLAIAADNLRQMGYTNVTSMDGGWREWTTAALPISRD